MTQAPANLVTDHRVAHGLGHDKAGARRGGLRRLIDKKVDDHRAAPGPAPTANRCGEVSAAPQSLRRGQHDYLDIRPDQRRLRPTACRGPWRGGWRGWRGRHGYACAAGNRGSSHDGGCSAGKCACSRQNSVFVGHPRDRRRPGGIKAARRHFSRARRSNRPTLRRAVAVVNHILGRHADRLGLTAATRSFRAQSESFPANVQGRARSAVVVHLSPLLACAVAGLTGRSHTAKRRPKPDKQVDRSPR